MASSRRTWRRGERIHANRVPQRGPKTRAAPCPERQILEQGVPSELLIEEVPAE